MTDKTKRFLQKLKDSGHWNDYYDYSKVECVNNKTKVIVINKKCDTEHLMTPAKLMIGSKCNMYNVVDANDYLIKRFREVHGDKYDYSKIEYVNAKTKVTIICEEHGHGEFEQLPIVHKRGHGCPTCGDVKLTTEEVIEQFREVHGNTYDYSKVNYINSKTKVIIICPKHGEFEQTPNNHKRGHGCTRCKESKGEREIRNLLIDKDIDFNQEQTFDDCKNILPLRFDFYLPDHNVCIEYQGRQHYEPVDFFGGISGFENRQYRDKIKEGYCIDNNIQLLKIRYDEDVSNFLNEYFNSKCTINLEY